RTALRRDGGVGTGGVRRGLHAAGNADREGGRRFGPNQGLRGDRTRRRYPRGRNSRVLQRSRQGTAVPWPQRRSAGERRLTVTHTNAIDLSSPDLVRRSGGAATALALPDFPAPPGGDRKFGAAAMRRALSRASGVMR